VSLLRGVPSQPRATTITRSGGAHCRARGWGCTDEVLCRCVYLFLSDLKILSTVTSSWAFFSGGLAVLLYGGLLVLLSRALFGCAGWSGCLVSFGLRVWLSSYCKYLLQVISRYSIYPLTKISCYSTSQPKPPNRTGCRLVLIFGRPPPCCCAHLGWPHVGMG